jgi:hypothetical protein
VPDNAIRAARLLGVTNLAEITVGLGAPLAHDELRATRNLLAHSLPNTWIRFRALQAMTPPTSSFQYPADYALQLEPQSMQSRIFYWMDDLEAALLSAAR